MVKGFKFALIEIQHDALLLVYWDHTAAKTASSLTTSSPAAFSGLAAFHLAECFADLGGSQTQGEEGRQLELISWPFKLNIEEPNTVLYPCHQLVFISERKLVGIIEYTVLANGLCGPSVWRHVKHHHHHGILWRIPLSRSPTLYAWPCAWRHCLLDLRCLVSLVRGLVGFEPCTLL